MRDTCKSNVLQERTRRKYVRTRGRRPEQERRLRGLSGRLARQERLNQRLKEIARQKRLAERQRDPNGLQRKKERERQAELKKRREMEKQKSQEKVAKAKEHLKEAIRKMKSQEASAAQKEAVQEMKLGHADKARRQMKESAMDSALGNEIGHVEGTMAENLNTLRKETGKQTDSTMQKMLRDNSVPADSFNKEKRTDMGDRNLEEKRTQDSTMQQMVNKKLYERRFRGG